MSREPILEVSEVTKTFGGIIALNRLSFDLFEGEILGIIGPNGSGKTTVVTASPASSNPPPAGSDSAAGTSPASRRTGSPTRG
jgi:branched-chain amino acid transport system ATP-binding protein